jgi:hypothetical protein
MNFKNKSELFENSETKGRELPGKKITNIKKNVISQHVDDEEEIIYNTWKDVSISKKVMVFSFRIPKKDMQQLKYISNRTGLSVNSICLLAIQANNRKVLKEFEEH